MASVHKDPKGRSPYYFASFYGADGRRKFRSTKEKSRTAANAVAVGWEKAAQKARKKELTAAQARKVLAEMVEHSTGESLTHYTASSWFEEWLTVKAASASDSTMTRYKQVIRDFKESLGVKADSSLSSITPGDIALFRDELHKAGRAPSTVNMVVRKILSVPFEDARRRGYIPINPVHGVDAIKARGDERTAGREPFTDSEITALLQAAEGDWLGTILCAVTTGLRLGDVTALTWDAVDETAAVLRVRTQKTGASLATPLHSDFAGWLANPKRSRGIGKAPVFPTLFGQRIGGRHGLSAQFREIMEAAGINGRVVKRKGKGRTRQSKDFHALRHTFVSELANANVPPDVRQKLAGHADERVHAGYTHHQIETLRAAVSKLPCRIGQKDSAQ